jgi:chromosomal replication initiator protein
VTGADIDLADLWRRTLLALESAGVSPSERAFVGFARLMAVIEQTALIAVPNDYTKKVLESDVRENLVRALGDSLGREIGLAVTVDPSLEQSIPPVGRTLGSRTASRAQPTPATAAPTRVSAAMARMPRSMPPDLNDSTPTATG